MATLHPYSDSILNKILMQSSAQIMVGLDFSLLDHMLIKRASQIAQHTDCYKVVFLHVISEEVIPDKMHSDFRIINEEEAEKFRTEMIEEVEDNFPLHENFEIEYVIRRGKPLYEFMKLCRERNFELILLGKKNELRGESILSYEVARYCACPVMFIPESVRMRLKNIMVCNDFSVFSRNAMEYALKLSEKDAEDMSIYSVHAYRDLATVDETDAELEELAVLNRQKLISLYNNFITPLDIGEVHVKPVFSKDRHNNPARVLLDEARKHAVDLIIVGSRSRSVSSPAFINSTTEKLLHYENDIPILVMKKTGRQNELAMADDQGGIAHK